MSTFDTFLFKSDFNRLYWIISLTALVEFLSRADFCGAIDLSFSDLWPSLVKLSSDFSSTIFLNGVRSTLALNL